mmetsp:Transcript_29160/g.33359  ORF Transcript_29160/g.33359 Transcript_29160/m.33359 type:complete len:192 (-) Transcript_29160:2189-2764(-)
MYIIIFIFKVNSMLLTMCNDELSKANSLHLKDLIDENILNAIDTLRTSSMIFKILSAAKNDAFCYSNEIFSITSYFCNKILMMRPDSVQEKFFGFFVNDSTSQNLFKQFNEYINMHIAKLSKGILMDFYSQQNYTDEMSKNCYIVDKNLEKQIVVLLKSLCSNDNTKMQNYMRFQYNNAKSYNMVNLMVDY